jgi:hypothetical protein
MIAYTGATLKCPVLGQFRLTMAERGWTRQNGPAIQSMLQKPERSSPNHCLQLWACRDYYWQAL